MQNIRPAGMPPRNTLLPFYRRRYMSLLCLLLFLSVYMMGLLERELRAYSDQSGNYYYQLTGIQKQIYGYLKDLRYNDAPLDLTFLASGISCTTSGDLTEEDRAMLTKNIQEDLQISVDAFLKDYPDCFWLDVRESKCQYQFKGNLSSGNKIVWYVSSVIYHFEIEASYQANVAAVEAELKQAIQDFPISGKSRYEILRSIHDGLARTVSYRETGQRAHDAVGALLDGEAVCEGYAKAFKLLCDRYNIPCVLGMGLAYAEETGEDGEPHMWNYVRMEDGKWYGVDVTWDDQQWGIYYDYFLVGSQTEAISFGGIPFGQSHRFDGDFSGTKLKVFTYPELSLTAYDPSVTPTPTETSSFSATPSVSPTPTPSGSVGPTSTSGFVSGTIPIPSGDPAITPTYTVDGTPPVSFSPPPSRKEAQSVIFWTAGGIFAAAALFAAVIWVYKRKR